jgi:hypothetical protein
MANLCKKYITYTQNISNFTSLKSAIIYLTVFTLFYKLFIIYGILYEPAYKIYAMILALSYVNTIIAGKFTVIKKKIILKRIDSIITIILLGIIIYSSII